MPPEQRRYAHSLKDSPPELWHDLRDHLEDTATRAEQFASPFALGWGRLAGLWHDAGKYQDAFQRHIGVDPEAHCNERVDHSSVGALIADKHRAAALAFVIACHHGGLADAEKLRSRLTSRHDLLDEARRGGLPRALESEPLPAAPAWIGADPDGRALWVRFLFSALTDADFLDTERFYQGVERDSGLPLFVPGLRDRLDAFVDGLAAQSQQTSVNAMRARVLADCRAAAELPRGALDRKST